MFAQMIERVFISLYFMLVYFIFIKSAGSKGGIGAILGFFRGPHTTICDSTDRLSVKLSGGTIPRTEPRWASAIRCGAMGGGLDRLSVRNTAKRTSVPNRPTKDLTEISHVMPRLFIPQVPI